MSLLLFATLAISEPTIPQIGCEPDAPVRDLTVCEPLYDDGEYKIQNVESVAVGSNQEMQRIREMTSICGLDNRIDGLGGVDLAVYDIFNATTFSRACVRELIAEHAPNLIFSEQRLSEKVRNAPPLEESETL